MLKNILLICTLFAAAYGTGQLSVLHAPKSLLFKGTDKIESSDLGALVTACMGNSIEKSSTSKNVYILDPFNTPDKSLIVSVDGVNKLSFQNIKATKFPVTGENGFDSLEEATYRVQEQSSVVANLDLSEGIAALGEYNNIFGDLKVKTDDIKTSLKPHENADEKIVLEQIAIINAISKAASNIELPAILYIRVTLAPLAADSAAFAEALRLLVPAMEELSNAFEETTNGNILSIVYATKAEIHQRSRRAAGDEDDDINLAATYNDTYPVIFNIILWFGVVMAFSLLAISYAIGTMDPGRDSIIYRMTSTRIKKDN